MPAPKKQPRGPIGATLSPEGVQLLQSRGVQVTWAWQATPAQQKAMTRTEFEVFYAGGKGGGKTEAGLGWLTMGNPDKPDFGPDGKPIMVNQGYYHHPKFLGAVIRLNEKDLAEWVDRARPLYCDVLGAEFTKNPTEFRWRSGARIFVGHMKDSDAYTKYQGQNIVRFLIEEAGQIPSLDLFDLVRSCCRSIYPEMRAQLFLTANPGGPGQNWLMDRYLEPKDRDGRPIKHPKFDRPILYSDGGMIPIIEEVDNPLSPGQKIRTSRIWVPSYLTDNPHLKDNTQYIATLATIRDEKMRKAYLLGDWRALSGGYFDIFHKDTHTYDPKTRPLMSWWRATGSLDWGFVHESAAYKHKQDPETQQHLVYSEFVTSRTDPVELGKELARWWMPELRVQGSVVLHVSHDLFHNKIGEFTWADLISKGIQQVLGQGTCYLPDQLIRKLKEQYQLDGKEWTDDMEDRLLSKPVQGITLRKAPSARAVGFMHLRSLMRTESSGPPPGTPDFDVALKIMAEGTAEDYTNYLKSFSVNREILPQMLISQECPRLIDAIPKAQHDEKNPEDIDATHFIGADELDSLRYLCAGLRDSKPTAMPIELERERMIQQARQRNPELTAQQLMYLNYEIDDQLKESRGAEEPFCLGRGARGSRYIQQVLQ